MSSNQTPRTTCTKPLPPSVAVDLWPALDPSVAERYARITRQVVDTEAPVYFPFLAECVEGESAFVERDGGVQVSPAYHRVYRAVEDLADRGIVLAGSRPGHVVDDGETVETTRGNGGLWVYPDWIPPALRSPSASSRR